MRLAGREYMYKTRMEHRRKPQPNSKLLENFLIWPSRDSNRGSRESQCAVSGDARPSGQAVNRQKNSLQYTGELGYDGPLYDGFLHMTDDMLGPSPMHIKYSSYVNDGFCI